MRSIEPPKTTAPMSITDRPSPTTQLPPNDSGARARVAGGGRVPEIGPPRYRPRPAQQRSRSRRGALFVLHHPRPRYRSGLSPAKRRGGYVRTALAAFLGSTGLLALLVLVVLGGGALAAWQYVTYDLPALDNIHLIDFQSTKIYDRHGTLLYEISDPTLGKRTHVAIDQMPRDLINATIAAEDSTFYENRGVDVRGIFRAALINLTGQGSSGASTITMQLVRRVLLPEQDEVSWRRKIREAILASQFTEQNSKDKILEIYLNEIYYGSLAYGVDAAAEVYYGKSVKDLTLAQSAMLAGLPQAPSFFDLHVNFDQAKKRQQYVLQQMVDNSFLSQEEADMAYAEDVRPVDRGETAPLEAPHFVNYVRALLESRYGVDMVNRGGLKVFTTIDMRFQGLAEKVAREQIAALRHEDASNASLVALNPRTGEILAMLGSVDFNDPEFGQVNVAIAPRQPGSVFKPLVYATAFEQGMSPATLLDDIPTTFNTGIDEVPYAPKNYDLTFRGPVLARRALANSLNVPTVELMQKVGVSAVLDTARRMGITNLDPDPSKYGLSLSLGANDVRLLDMTSVYATFANGGVHIAPVALLDVQDGAGNTLYHYDEQHPEGSRAITPQESYLITDILSDNNARAEVFGAESALLLSRKAAAKTGTTENYRDSWTMGYTPALAVGAWVGNNDGHEMARIAGARGAGPIWHNFMEGVFANPDLEKILLEPGEKEVPRDFAVPPDLVRVPVCALGGLKLSPADTDVINELFIVGHTPTAECNLNRLVKVDISHDPPLLANQYCNPQSVVERPYIVLPPHYDDWIKTQGGTQWTGPPTEGCAPAAPTAVPILVPPTEPPSLITSTMPIDPQAPPVVALPDEYPGAVLLISSPRAGSTLGPEVSITGSADGPNFDHYELLYASASNPTNWTTINGQGLLAVRNAILGYWRTSDLGEGAYILRLLVVGRSGESRSIDVRVVVERSTPSLNLAYPAQNTEFQIGEIVYMAANASGAQGVLGVEFYVDGVRVASDSVAPYEYNWTATNGNHLLAAVAFSPSGRRATSATVTIIVSERATPRPTVPPAFDLVAPQSGSVLTATEAPLIVQTDTAGIARVDYYVDGVMINTVWGSGLFEMKWQTVAGQHVLMAIGYDSSGNELARSRVIVLVNP